MLQPIFISDAKYMTDYSIALTFNDGKKMVMDFSGIIQKSPVFKPLANVELFRNFHINDWTLEWANGEIDIAPEYLYEHGVAAD